MHCISQQSLRPVEAIGLHVWLGRSAQEVPLGKRPTSSDEQGTQVAGSRKVCTGLQCCTRHCCLAPQQSTKVKVIQNPACLCLNRVAAKHQPVALHTIRLGKHSATVAAQQRDLLPGGCPALSTPLHLHANLEGSAGCKHVPGPYRLCESALGPQRQLAQPDRHRLDANVIHRWQSIAAVVMS